MFILTLSWSSYLLYKFLTIETISPYTTIRLITSVLFLIMMLLGLFTRSFRSKGLSFSSILIAINLVLTVFLNINPGSFLDYFQVLSGIESLTATALLLNCIPNLNKLFSLTRTIILTTGLYTSMMLFFEIKNEFLYSISLICLIFCAVMVSISMISGRIISGK